MKLSCPKTGIVWHASVGYGAQVAEHPVFSATLKYLTNVAISAEPGITTADRYLAGCALLNYLVAPGAWRVPLTDGAVSHVISNISDLASTVIKTLATKLEWPHITINRDTADLYNLQHYLVSINESIDSVARISEEREELNRKTGNVERLINSNLHRNTPNTAKLLADWAEAAAKFPQESVTYLPDGTPIALTDYWKAIIISAHTGKHVEMLGAGIDADEVSDLIDWLEFNLEMHGTPQSTELMKSLRTAKEVLEDFSTPMQVQVTKQDADPEPVRKDFKSSIDYLKAKAKWNRENKVNADYDSAPINTSTTLGIEL